MFNSLNSNAILPVYSRFAKAVPGEQENSLATYIVLPKRFSL